MGRASSASILDGFYYQQERCRLFQSFAEVGTFDVVKADTIRYETIVEGKAPMFTNMCLQAEIFKYSNLIKTKKKFKTENQKTFYIFDQILHMNENISGFCFCLSIKWNN